MTETKDSSFLNSERTKRENDFAKKKKGILFFLLLFLCACGIYRGQGKTATDNGFTQEEADGDTFTDDGAEQESFAEHGFYFQTLTGGEQIWYQDIYTALNEMSAETDLSEEYLLTLGEEAIDRIFKCVLNDHPELFFVTGYSYSTYTYCDEITRITFLGTYTMTAEERAETEKLLDAAAEEWLAGISQDASEYEKVKYVYETLIEATEYRQDAADSQNICSVLLNKASVCQGYAKTTQYLLNRLGVEATMVMGTVKDGGSHAWNLVRIDGEYYYVDTTWGDASYQIQENAAAGYLPPVSYEYLCITTEQLLKTHTPENFVKLPECTSMESNYYVKEGIYFTEYEEEAVKALFEKNTAENRRDITLKCADGQVYQKFLEELVTNQKIFNYMNNADGSIAYVENPEKFSLTFWLVNE